MTDGGKDTRWLETCCISSQDMFFLFFCFFFCALNEHQLQLRVVGNRKAPHKRRQPWHPQGTQKRSPRDVDDVSWATDKFFLYIFFVFSILTAYTSQLQAVYNSPPPPFCLQLETWRIFCIPTPPPSFWHQQPRRCRHIITTTTTATMDAARGAQPSLEPHPAALATTTTTTLPVVGHRWDASSPLLIKRTLYTTSQPLIGCFNFFYLLWA